MRGSLCCFFYVIFRLRHITSSSALSISILSRRISPRPRLQVQLVIRGICVFQHTSSAMAMPTPTVSPLPTILIKGSTNVEPDREAGTRNAPIPAQCSWLQKFRFCVSLIIAHWGLISYVPLDIYFRGVSFTKTQQKPKEESASTDSTASQNGLKGTIGQLALHPSLPLLAVCISGSRDIIFYHTRTCRKLQNVQIKLPRIVTGNNGSAVRCSITCLKLSTWNKLAIGLSVGTVWVVEQNLLAMLAAEGVNEDKRLRIQEVKLLPYSSSDISFKFLGPITNLVFPSSADVTSGGDSWLAITTENSGVWIWNERTKQSIRVINTVGINQGCLHWINLSVKQSPAVSTLERNRRLNNSTHRKLENIFGSSALSGLDQYYSSSPEKSTLSSLAKSPTLLPKPRANSLRSSSGVVTLQAPVYDEGSLLIFGTKDGKIQVNKIFHSSRMMNFITSVNFYPAAIAQPTAGTFQSISGPASGEITHLVTQSHQITESSITLPIFVASKSDNSSILHQFSIALLRKQVVKSDLSQVRDTTEAALRSLVNIVLGLIKVRYRWLPRSHPTDPSQGGTITNHMKYSIHLPTRSTTTTAPEKVLLMSACTQPGTDLILTTLRLNQLSSKCVIFAHNQLSATLNPTPVNPLFPIATSLSEPLVPSPSLLRGHYLKQLADAGLYAPASASSSSPRRRQQEARVGMTCVHDIACEGITWGKSERGVSMGAFIYTPASNVDNGVAIGMFEVSI